MKEKVIGRIEINDRTFRYVERKDYSIPTGCRFIVLQEEVDGKPVPIRKERAKKLEAFTEKIEKKLHEIISRKE